MSTASLDAAAAARKERLSQLKSLKRKAPTSSSSSDESASAPTALGAPTQQQSTDKDVSHLLSGRNYDIVERAPKMGFSSLPTENQETLEDAAAKIAEETRQHRVEAEKEDKPIDLFNLQPKKPNWDLKRDVDKKLERLDQRTDMAIAKLIRARIIEEKAKDKGGMEEDDVVEGNLAKMVEEREKEGDELDGEVEEE
ncbi:cwf18 pre-mRNA splicing factor-domain-containing protein [Tricharina praecox]|uniref:cwf18 pre-mRNA splicing factor-domain-containing protein n=1 Tax=Tricharina praecox TaxID=43433 RepID=UPI00221E6B17|nr:cwf18 pre-mRNA splicing factor-domain-containing protein [Tricharina praecox]KAI5857145.1 cwf18 pre-mRNA splicing factor-domain-containing protein [Tricharina praecox]